MGVPRTEQAWAAYVAELDESARSAHGAMGADGPVGPEPRKPKRVTTEELDAIIASATRRRGKKGATSGVMRGLECTSMVLEFVGSMASDPVYAVLMFALVIVNARGDLARSVGAAMGVIMEIAGACMRIDNSEIEIAARATMARFFAPMSTDKKHDAFACLMYACARHATHIGVSVGAYYGHDAIASLSLAVAGIAQEYTQIDDLELCAAESPERETYHGVTELIANVVKLETVLRLVPGIAAVVRQAFPAEQNTVYSPMYATHVVALVETIKEYLADLADHLADYVPGPVRAVLDTVREYHKMRLIFYLLLALKYSSGDGSWSFLDTMLMLECPLCARVVARVRADTAP